MLNERSFSPAAAAPAAPTLARRGDRQAPRLAAQRWRRRGLLAVGAAVVLAASLVGQSGARAAGTSPGAGPTPTSTSSGGGAQQPVNPCALATSCGPAGGGSGSGQQGGSQSPFTPAVNPCALPGSCGPAGGGSGSGGSLPTTPTGNPPSLSATSPTVSLKSCQDTSETTTLTWDTGTKAFHSASISVSHKNGPNQPVYTIPLGQQKGTTPQEPVYEGDNTFTLTVDGSSAPPVDVQGQCIPNSPCLIQNCGGGGGNNGPLGCITNPACIQPQPPAPLVLQATRTLTSEIFYQGWNSTWCAGPLATPPGFSLPAGEIEAGFSDWSDNSFSPVDLVDPCKSFLMNDIFRGGVGFDMVNQVIPYIQQHGVTSATLQFSAVDGSPNPPVLGCVSHILATDDASWESWGPGPDRLVSHGDGYQIDAPDGIDWLPDTGPDVLSGNLSSTSVDVTAFVALAGIYNGADQHFVFVGRDEGLNNSSDDATCEIMLGNFSLTITPDH